MYIVEQLIFPILTNIISPLILFLIASIIMRNNTMSIFISKIYKSVKQGLEINTEDIVEANEITASSKILNDSIDKISEESDDKESDVLRKLSKNYGPDNESGWEVRTYYTFTKQQLIDNQYINFKVRDNKFDIYLKTADLIKYFGLDNSCEQVSDGAGRIRVYIFQKTNSNNEKENYFVRFGKKALENPIKIEHIK
ncbi:hypothetical protein [Streptococcus suis]|uniref:hypothetical protein n=1 Tax=Streptococcus suis TaxID=1307 RepID=UPI001ABE1BB0|nr:hypothetical protein [Streptococcus suis]